MSSVLIVDDSMLIRMQLKHFFENELNYDQVYLASDGDQAIEIFKNNSPDLVTLDLTMPIKDGMETLRELLKINQKVKVLMISAIKDSNQILECMNLGAKGFIKKPLTFSNPEFVKELKEDILEAYSIE